MNYLSILFHGKCTNVTWKFTEIFKRQIHNEFQNRILYWSILFSLNFVHNANLILRQRWWIWPLFRIKIALSTFKYMWISSNILPYNFFSLIIYLPKLQCMCVEKKCQPKQCLWVCKLSVCNKREMKLEFGFQLQPCWYSLINTLHFLLIDRSIESNRFDCYSRSEAMHRWSNLKIKTKCFIYLTVFYFGWLNFVLALFSFSNVCFLFFFLLHLIKTGRQNEHVHHKSCTNELLI